VAHPESTVPSTTKMENPAPDLIEIDLGEWEFMACTPVVTIRAANIRGKDRVQKPRAADFSTARLVVSDLTRCRHRGDGDRSRYYSGRDSDLAAFLVCPHAFPGFPLAHAPPHRDYRSPGPRAAPLGHDGYRADPVESGWRRCSCPHSPPHAP